MKKQVIAYLHTHWDREWYREYEVFRLRLLRVFDNVLDLLDTNKIPCFYFDGQISALEDYLEIRPEKKPLIKSLIFSKKLYVGPFYCLVDEFLTDKTCFSKNLELGMKTAIELGCTDFIGYLADTFGHSQNVVDVMRDFGIGKCIVWRGCGDFPSEFKWCGADTVNLVRGYFNNIFSLKISMEEKAKLLKKELDLIAEKSGEYLLLPIGADHLGVETDIQDQINTINELLKDDYEITLSSPFEYFRKVEGLFEQFEWNDELRDNSKTFTLQGCYSSRLDLKRYNTECSHKLNLASRFVRFVKAEKKYENILNYAYKMLIRNQAHDSICGCSTDDVHSENIIRYKKIMQIANTIIDELKFANNFDKTRLINLSDRPFSGVIELNTTKTIDEYEKISSKKGFDAALLTDTQQIPVTEDYTDINTYLVNVCNVQPDNVEFVSVAASESTLKLTDTSIENENISLKVKDGQVYINKIPFDLVDYVDLGDSYNNGPKYDDEGNILKVLRTKQIYNGRNRISLRIDFDGAWDVVSLIASLDKDANYIKLNFDWINSQKNHLLETQFKLPKLIKEVFSEDMDILIKRSFDAEYNIREHLPYEKGHEAKTNTAPMQRGLLVDEKKNNLGVITKGLTQYEVFENNILIPIMRATGCISNPENPARTTPAGPPIETPNLQMIGENHAEMYVFFGNKNDFDEVLNKVYNYIIV